MNLLRSTGCQVRSYVPFMNGRAIPDHQQFARYVGQQMPEKDHTIKAGQCLITHHRVKAAVHRDPAHHRHMIAGIRPPQDWCLSARCVRSRDPRQEIKPRFVHTHNSPAFSARLFLSSGQTSMRHGSIIASSRWAARWMGICGVQRKVFNNRETWALWYETPHASQITVATRAQVQNWPRNPYASAPWDKNSGIKRRWASVSFIGPVGLGLARHASTPCSRTCASHWLTAAGETANASAISRCFHPCCLSSNARFRRASFQVWGNPCCRSMCGCEHTEKIKLRMQRSVSRLRPNGLPRLHRPERRQ